MTIPEILWLKFNQIEAVIRHPSMAPSRAKEEIDMWLEKYIHAASIYPEGQEQLESLAQALYRHEKNVAMDRWYGADTIKLSTPQVVQKYREVIREKSEAQKNSLGTWVAYLRDPANKYPIWFRCYVLYSLQKMGEFRRWEKKYTKRTSRTTASFPEFNAECLTWVYDTITKGVDQNVFVGKYNKTVLISLANALLWAKRFSELYAFAQTEAIGSIDRSTTIGKWVKYEKWSSVTILKSAIRWKWTGWCTAEVEYAYHQLLTWDFYVYYTLNAHGHATEPRIAISMTDAVITEIRGIDVGQGLEPVLIDIVDQQWKHLGGYEKYQKATKDLKEVNRLYEKCFILDHKTREIKGRKEYNLSASDMYFIASDITSLQQEGDPRVAQIREFFTQIPDGVIFEKDVSFFRCQHLKKIGKWVQFLGSVDFRQTWIQEIPDDQPHWIRVLADVQTGKRSDIPDGTVFEKEVNFQSCRTLKSIGAWVKFMGNAGFEYSWLEVIEWGVIFENDVSFFACKSLEKLARWIQFWWRVDFGRPWRLQEIPDDQPHWIRVLADVQTGKRTDIPDGTVFEKDIILFDCKTLKKIGTWVRFMGSVNFEQSWIMQIEEGVIFEKDVSFQGSKNLAKISPWVIFRGNTCFLSTGIRTKPEWVVFEKEVSF